MMLKDGLGSVLQVTSDGTWAHVNATVRLNTLLMSYVLQLIIVLAYYRWKRRKANAKN